MSDVERWRQSDATGIAKHLNTLAATGLARDTWSGRERFWERESERPENARRCLDQIAERWDAGIGRLKEFVERER